jgi:hypothetical protein
MQFFRASFMASAAASLHRARYWSPFITPIGAQVCSRQVGMTDESELNRVATLTAVMRKVST